LTKINPFKLKHQLTYRSFTPNVKKWLSFAWLFFIAFFATGQISSARLVQEGDGYYEQQAFRAALQYYQEAGNAETWKKETKLRVGICQFEINRLDESIRTLNDLIAEGKTDPTVYLYIAKSNQHRNQFENAIKFYKQFLRKGKTDELTREWTKDEIKRCANGMHLKFGEEIAYIENLGAEINTLLDEMAPLPSPNYQDRLYFSSNRFGSKGEKLNRNGQVDSKYGSSPYDIFTIEKANGAWQQVLPMQGEFNTGQHDYIYDFSLDGQIVYHFQGNTFVGGNIFTDTFQLDPELPPKRGRITSPIKSEYGDQDLRIFNDTILLFSSARPGGYGGYDLYICVNRYGKWLDPMNLGPRINSFYDERHPFLATNGRTLFFSSNNLKSTGGLDIFRSDFLDAEGKWSDIQNLGIPVNSPADDIHFELSSDGSFAYMSSNRKSGFGGFDLYSIYFKNQVQEQLKISIPVSFYQQMEISERRLDEIGDSLLSGSVDPDMIEKKEYYIGDLYYNSDDVIVTPQNIKKLELITNMMLIYPKIELEMVCHEASDITSAFSLYFSIKKAEKARDFLVRKGVDVNRIHIKGAGNYFPISSSGKMSPLINKLNRRIDIRFHKTETEPIKILKEQVQIPELIDQDEQKNYEELTRKLYYMVQIASTTQMYQNPILENEDYAMIEFEQSRKQYRYLVGMAKDYKQIKKHLEELKSKGFNDAFVVPYIGGMRIERNAVLDYADQYPDLLNLFE
jgi:outer membrane protein OmpA-like peptidoglycan-associated protein